MVAHFHRTKPSPSSAQQSLPGSAPAPHAPSRSTVKQSKSLVPAPALHGIWSHTGGQSYHAVDEAFIFNPAGAWVSTQKLTQEIQLAADGDTFSSNATTEFFDTAGNLTATGCATAIATRME
jgi:hypothetical protein